MYPMCRKSRLSHATLSDTQSHCPASHPGRPSSCAPISIRTCPEISALRLSRPTIHPGLPSAICPPVCWAHLDSLLQLSISPRGVRRLGARLSHFYSLRVGTCPFRRVRRIFGVITVQPAVPFCSPRKNCRYLVLERHPPISASHYLAFARPQHLIPPYLILARFFPIAIRTDCTPTEKRGGRLRCPPWRA